MVQFLTSVPCSITLCWTLCKRSLSFLNRGAQNWIQYSGMWPHQGRVNLTLDNMTMKIHSQLLSKHTGDEKNSVLFRLDCILFLKLCDFKPTNYFASFGKHWTEGAQWNYNAKKR